MSHGHDDLRNRFASFLEELANGPPELDVWQELVVNHYFDDLTESVRRQLGRICIDPKNTTFPTGQADLLRDWAKRLRAGDISLQEQEYRNDPRPPA